MSLPSTDFESLISGLQLRDSRLYDALRMLNDRVSKTEEELFPLVQKSSLVSVVVGAFGPPALFTFVFTPNTVRLGWTAVVGAGQYEVRKGSNWELGDFLFKTTSLSADIDPLLIGSHQFMIKTINVDGEYSTAFTSCIVDVPEIPAVTIAKQTIDNTILLTWNVPASSFRINYYTILKDGVQVGQVDATFFSRFEVVGGTYVYRVIPVDIAGNQGNPADISVLVQNPPDYALQDQRTSDLNGTRVNVLKLLGPKLLANWAATDWQTHFTGRAWLDPEDQVTAGYPIYIQPANLTGSYEEVFDYGTVISNVIATVTWNFNLVTPGETMTVLVRMATSNDNITYSAFTNGASQFFQSFRYLKVRLEFTGSTDKCFYELYNLTISLNVKRENDGGELTANLGDVGGTEVLFNKAFKDVESITATVKSTTEPYVVIIDFNDIPNPVSFRVYVFDTTGNRVTKVVEWKARGIV